MVSVGTVLGSTVADALTYVDIPADALVVGFDVGTPLFDFANNVVRQGSFVGQV